MDHWFSVKIKKKKLKKNHRKVSISYIWHETGLDGLEKKNIGGSVNFIGICKKCIEVCKMILELKSIWI